MAAAWHGAAFSRVKKIPALDKVLGDRPKALVQSHDEMLAAMQSLARSSV